MWELEFYEDENGRAPCREWMDDLPGELYSALVEAFERVLRVNGLDVCSSEWGKQLGGGLFEFRVRHSAVETARMFAGVDVPHLHSKTKKAVMLRVFCHAYGNRIVLLLSGYDKGRHPETKRQDREIKKARKLLADFKGPRRRS